MHDDTVLRRRVAESRVARLATLDADGRPHVVPIGFALAGDPLYSAVDEKPKRLLGYGYRQRMFKQRISMLRWRYAPLGWLTWRLMRRRIRKKLPLVR